MKFVRVNNFQNIAWHLHGKDHLPMGLAIVATPKGVEYLGGSPGFDTKAEEAAWALQYGMAVIAVKIMHQGSNVPSDESLRNLARSVAKPEQEFT
jgi:hypothetical protein